MGLIFSLLISQTSFALPEDRQQPLQLKAGIADINQATHIGTYTHDVALDQGSTHLRADSAITEVGVKNQLIKAIANGNTHDPAHFWTLIDPQKLPLHAYAKIIRYFPERHLIQLEGNARVVQGLDSFSAPKISYDTLHQHIFSQSKGEPQTIILIHPEASHE